MKHRALQCLVVSAIAGICLFNVPIGAADKPVPLDSVKLGKILGEVKAWKIPANSVIHDEGGKLSLAPASGQTLAIEGLKDITGPAEYSVAFRLKITKTAAASLAMQLLSATRADKTPQALHVGVSAAPAATYVNHSMSAQGPKDFKPLSGVLHFEAVSDRSLAWPEEMRRTIESQIASAPKIEDTLFTVRVAVGAKNLRWWLNGRFLGESPIPADLKNSGKFHLQLSPAAELVALRVRPLPEASQRFEPISIGGNVNSGTLTGARVDAIAGTTNSDQLDISKSTTVGGVPFEFPKADERGQDHLDVSQSWNRFGALPGYFMSNSGMFGGRWVAANRIDPARLAMYVPRGRYKALHLIAVADGRPDSLPIVSAQFYRPDAGHPENFSGTVPGISAKASSSAAVPVTLANGKTVNLHHVTIPLNPDSFSWFGDLDQIALEITKQVYFYRAYPDPLEYSYHAGGLPSSVQVYAMTLERAGVDVDVQPEKFGHVWTAPEKPAYSVVLQNNLGKASNVKLVVTTRSHDGKDTSSQVHQVSLPPTSSPVKVPVGFQPKRHGLHEVTVALESETDKSISRRNFAWLHEDTREQKVWETGHGPIFGFWAWSGGHTTPTVDKEIPIMAAAGAETSTTSYARHSPEIQELAKKHHFMSEAAFDAGVMYRTGFVFSGPGYPKWDPAKPEESGKELVENLKKTYMAPGPLSRPVYVPFFAEPQLGNITTGIWPTHYGEEYKLNAGEQATYESMLARYLAAATAIRKEWPNLKLLMPYGDPMNTAIFLRLNEKVRDLIDGCALDIPGFERLPEQQINQVVLNRMYAVLGDIRKYKRDPYFMLIEGTHISSKDIDTQEIGQADISMRNYLVLMGYGIFRFDSGNAPFDCANYWGENHYGGGWCSRVPLAMPKTAYAHLATLTRNLNRANFVKYVPTGSTSTYCQQYRHYKTGALIHPIWTIRGKRPVTLQVAAGTKVQLVDPHDNATTLSEKDGKITFVVDQSPQYITGLNGDPQIILGESDHSDASPAKLSVNVANPGDGSWQISDEIDLEYRKNKPQQIERFPAKMTARVVSAPQAQGTKALAVHLGPQEKDRGVMPFFTTLRPAKPVLLPGKGSHLGMWVHAASDWGRVVYSLRDAKGEKWISIGAKEEWNCDDIHGWSNFCFDGWRYVQFELPSSAPYDSYREHGTAWWGSYGGDGVVDLPLHLEKIIVERRPKAIYGNDLVEVKKDDVLLGDLYVEYAQSADQTQEAVRLSALRMPLPATTDLDNPIARLKKTGVGAPVKVTKVTDPEREYDGTRCHVHFEPVAAAKSYDVWVSPYADGRGALQLGSAWAASGQLITGLRPDREFYVFVIYTDKAGKLSLPSEPLKFTLKDRFGYK